MAVEPSRRPALARCIGSGSSTVIRCSTPPFHRSSPRLFGAARAGWNVMSYRIATNISCPWSARPEGEPKRRTGGGTGGGAARGISSPPWTHVVENARHSGLGPRRDTSRRKALSAWQLCAVSRRRVFEAGRRLLPPTSAGTKKQPGRERPPLAHVDPSPGRPEGVAHVPANAAIFSAKPSQIRARIRYGSASNSPALRARQDPLFSNVAPHRSATRGRPACL